MKFEFWLKNEKEKIDLLLPVTPASYSITYGNSIETVEVSNLGDINIAGKRRAITVILESFFSTKEENYVNRQTYAVNNTFEYVELIKKWINNKDIIRLIIADENVTKINAEFYIEEIVYKESNETNGDIDYTIKLREYRKLNLIKEEKITVDTPRATKTAPNSKSYTVVSGDSLSKIARKMYGDVSKWQSIYNANKSLIGNNPSLIYPGQILVIP